VGNASGNGPHDGGAGPGGEAAQCLAAGGIGLPEVMVQECYVRDKRVAEAQL